jgi:hypothetical protein
LTPTNASHVTWQNDLSEVWEDVAGENYDRSDTRGAERSCIHGGQKAPINLRTIISPALQIPEVTAMGNSWSFTETPKHLQKSSKTKSVIWTFEDFTEDAPDDDKIKRGVKGLQLAIYKHADYYYHDEQSRCIPQQIEELLKTLPNLPNLSTQEFAHLLCDTRSRHAAICSFISHMVTKNMEFSGSRTDTLLVPCILDCMAELQVGDPHIKLSEGILNLLSS